MELVVLVNNSGATTMNASEIDNALGNGTFVCLFDDGLMYYPNRYNNGAFEFVHLSDPSDIVYVTSDGSISYEQPIID